MANPRIHLLRFVNSSDGNSSLGTGIDLVSSAFSSFESPTTEGLTSFRWIEDGDGEGVLVREEEEVMMFLSCVETVDIGGPSFWFPLSFIVVVVVVEPVTTPLKEDDRVLALIPTEPCTTPCC